MPLQDYMKIVSVDDHVIEHPRVWQDRLPAKYQASGPQIITTAEGNHTWKYEGQLFPYIGVNAVAGREPKDFGMEPVRYQDMIPGCYEPDARVKDMDLDGVHAALCFPSFPGFGGGVFHRAKDKELAELCIKAWNDWHIDEWCGAHPDRLIPLGILPVWDIDATVKEVERLADKGCRTISFPDNPIPLGLPGFHDDYWGPLWDVCEETDMPVSLHFGSGGFVPGFPFSTATGTTGRSAEAAKTTEVPYAVAITLFSSNLMWSSVELLFSGQLQKHPKLQFILAEGGIGWLPYVLERADYTWERHRWYQDIDRNTRPSDLFYEHFWGCFIDDVHGIKNLGDKPGEIRADRVMLEIDYPHSDSNWPNSRKRAAETLVDLPDEDCHKITELNARKILRFDA
ncbi:amidohydrolase family protein [Nocardioides massiliensis]|uniref:TIM-barrel fold metal-dependent hydrolase n=1 Tax=Nocardioides massiliensis TaxID=1325935 RepID=A0ABT9NK20_9ACTN|nr:amidohydrolase family protein [Nocardioides massiliensis]MDP9820759.1 putative TIM-barrel fold metal-dependent hydrolase [Nocardioides massiliensis]